MFSIREQDDYNQDGGSDDTMERLQQQEKKERTAFIKEQFALRRGKNSKASSSSSSFSTLKNRQKEQREKQQAEKEEQDRASRSKLVSAQFTSKISGLNIAVSFLQEHVSCHHHV